MGIIYNIITNVKSVNKIVWHAKILLFVIIVKMVITMTFFEANVWNVILVVKHVINSLLIAINVALYIHVLAICVHFHGI